jgi:alginate O-acetyltransferase complex protein AlgI
MFFHTQAYLLFFLIVFAVYWAMPWRRPRVWLLLGASLYFYMQWSQELAFLVAGTATVDYLLARIMDRVSGSRSRKILLVLSLLMNLGLLCYFKYSNFFLASLNELLLRLGLESSFDLLKLIVPFGISFYTFEAISYSVDVYQRKIPAEKNLDHFLLFILFFPHLVSGPIVRGRDFLPQVQRRKRFSWLRMQLGMQFILMGLFKKMVIADRMAMFSDPVFQDPTLYSTASCWAGLVAFAFRIYCDFSGYTDMAIGFAHLLGYKLTLNFRMPYLSLNVSEFWRRWHISLSSWLRDYVFIPAGGSRGSRWFTFRNLMLTMLLGGMWHGANWTFLIWGGLHGSYLVIHRLFRDWSEKRPAVVMILNTSIGRLLRMGLTFLAVLFAWVFFQPSLSLATQLLQRLVIPTSGETLPLPSQSLWMILIIIATCHYLAATGNWRKFEPRIPAPVLGFGYAMVMMLCLLLAPPVGKQFVYFDF